MWSVSRSVGRSVSQSIMATTRQRLAASRDDAMHTCVVRRKVTSRQPGQYRRRGIDNWSTSEKASHRAGTCSQLRLMQPSSRSLVVYSRCSTICAYIRHRRQACAHVGMYVHASGHGKVYGPDRALPSASVGGIGGTYTHAHVPDTYSAAVWVGSVL